MIYKISNASNVNNMAIYHAKIYLKQILFILNKPKHNFYKIIIIFQQITLISIEILIPIIIINFQKKIPIKSKENFLTPIKANPINKINK